MNNVLELYGRDKINKTEFFVGWALNEDDILDLKKRQEEADEKKTYEFFIKYPETDKSV